MTLKQHIAFSYPEWKIIDCDSLGNAADMVIQEKADCFLMGASQALIYDNSQKLQECSTYKNNGGMLCCKRWRGKPFVNTE